MPTRSRVRAKPRMRARRAPRKAKAPHQHSLHDPAPAAPRPHRNRQPVERYTAALLANAQYRWEQTAEPARSIAADLGIMPTSLNRLAHASGWARRQPPSPPSGLPVALTIMQEAQALDEARSKEMGREAAPQVSLPPQSQASGGEGRAPKAGGVGGGVVDTEMPPDPSPAFAALMGGGQQPAAPAMQNMPERAAAPIDLGATIERLQRAVIAELSTIEAMRAELGSLPEPPPKGSRTARTLALLTQTLQHLQRLRAGERLSARSEDGNVDDDMPADIEEFRRELARRIDAFVASRSDQRDADNAGEPAVVGDVRS